MKILRLMELEEEENMVGSNALTAPGSESHSCRKVLALLDLIIEGVCYLEW